MELFERFEVNHEPRWQVLTKLVVGSLVLHVVFLWMAIYVPVFRDTFNIAALIASTGFVDRDYVATQIRDEVQVVQLEKFRYPDGYFALDSQLAGAIPGQAPAVDPFAPTIISQASKEPKVDPEASPSPSPEASPSASPSASAATSPNASAAASPAPSASPSAVAQASPLTPEEAQKQLEKTAEQNNVKLPEENQINKKPLKDLAAHMNDLKNQGKLDLNKPFEIVIEAELDENAKLTNARLTRKDGDEILQDLFTRMVTALNDSGLLIFLKPIREDNPGTTVRITLKQGEKDLLASVESEASSTASATKLANTYNGLLVAGAWSRAGKDEAELMKNSIASPDGKKVMVNFSMARQIVVDMLNKQLKPGV